MFTDSPKKATPSAHPAHPVLLYDLLRSSSDALLRCNSRTCEGYMNRSCNVFILTASKPSFLFQVNGGAPHQPLYDSRQCVEDPLMGTEMEYLHQSAHKKLNRFICQQDTEYQCHTRNDYGLPLAMTAMANGTLTSSSLFSSDFYTSHRAIRLRWLFGPMPKSGTADSAPAHRASCFRNRITHLVTQ